MPSRTASFEVSLDLFSHYLAVSQLFLGRGSLVLMDFSPDNTVQREVHSTSAREVHNMHIKHFLYTFTDNAKVA